MRILFIDDQPEVLTMFSNLLTRKFPGHIMNFACCTSLEQAKAAINEFQPDVIFIDHNISEDGDGTGLDIARTLVKTKTVFSISGSLETAEREEYSQIGVLMVGKSTRAISQAIITLENSGTAEVRVLSRKAATAGG